MTNEPGKNEYDQLRKDLGIDENGAFHGKTVDELEEENKRDSLTGAYNRRYLDRELAKMLNKGEKIALLMVDVDYFKVFNDTYGHQTGDSLLVHLVRKMSDRLRLARPPKKSTGEESPGEELTDEEIADIIARYGGEEFVIVLRDIKDIETARKIAEDLRLVATESKFRINKEKSAARTVSIGVALSREAESADELIKRADDAMYQAKVNGRNRVEVSTE